jgi:transcriptional regulator GlxA family with amidase domain
LKTSKASVEEIAAQVGYMDGRTLRLLLRQRLNLGVKQIRSASRI